MTFILLSHIFSCFVMQVPEMFYPWLNVNIYIPSEWEILNTDSRIKRSYWVTRISPLCTFVVPVCHLFWAGPRLHWLTVEPSLRSWYTTHHHALWWIYHTVGGPISRQYYFNTNSHTQPIWRRKTVVSYRYRINFCFKLSWCFYFKCTQDTPFMAFL